jgi:Flp pilus assembly protein TadG
MTSRARNISRCRLIGRYSDERGAFMIIFALVLLVILGFAALGVEAGRWYLVRAELAKGVDAAALAAAKNISNPYVSPVTLAQEFGAENFKDGYLGTPGSGTGEVQFNAEMVQSDKVRVTGHVYATAILAKVFGIDTVPISAASMAQRKDVEIMMILDRSGSMAGQKIDDLKKAANGFLNFFEDTQDRDKVGLISFAYHASVDRALGPDFVGPMRVSINAMNAIGATNMEDAIDQADGPKGLQDQTGVPGDKRVEQFVVFFSDGQPTAMRGKFRNAGKDYDAVAVHTGNCKPWETNTNSYRVVGPLRNALNGNDLGVEPLPTGDGKPSASSACGSATTKWYMFETRPVTGYSAESCSIPHSVLSGGTGYFCKTARQMALDHAKELKDKGIKIYAVGLGTTTSIDPDFLKALSSGEDFTYITPSSSELEAIFKKIAKEIKLRLVE